MTNRQPLTKCICHKGFSGYSSVVVRSNIRVGGQEAAPQSLTAHTLEGWMQILTRLTNEPVIWI
jgi:hypothetical protein